MFSCFYNRKLSIKVIFSFTFSISDGPGQNNKMPYFVTFHIPGIVKLNVCASLYLIGLYILYIYICIYCQLFFYAKQFHCFYNI